MINHFDQSNKSSCNDHINAAIQYHPNKTLQKILQIIKDFALQLDIMEYLYKDKIDTIVHILETSVNDDTKDSATLPITLANQVVISLLNQALELKKKLNSNMSWAEYSIQREQIKKFSILENNEIPNMSEKTYNFINIDEQFTYNRVIGSLSSENTYKYNRLHSTERAIEQIINWQTKMENYKTLMLNNSTEINGYSIWEAIIEDQLSLTALKSFFILQKKFMKIFLEEMEIDQILHKIDFNLLQKHKVSILKLYENLHYHKKKIHFIYFKTMLQFSINFFIHRALLNNKTIAMAENLLSESHKKLYTIQKEGATRALNEKEIDELEQSQRDISIKLSQTINYCRKIFSRAFQHNNLHQDHTLLSQIITDIQDGKYYDVNNFLVSDSALQFQYVNQWMNWLETLTLGDINASEIAQLSSNISDDNIPTIRLDEHLNNFFYQYFSILNNGTTISKDWQLFFDQFLLEENHDKISNDFFESILSIKQHLNSIIIHSQ